MKRNNLYLTLIIALSVIIITALITGVIIMWLCNCKEIPAGIIAIGSTGIGGLAGILVNGNLPEDPTENLNGEQTFEYAEKLIEKSYLKDLKDNSKEEAEKLKELRRRKLIRLLEDDDKKNK